MNYSKCCRAQGNGQNGHSFMVIGSNGLTNLCHVSSAARCSKVSTSEGPKPWKLFGSAFWIFQAMSHMRSRAGSFGSFGISRPCYPCSKCYKSIQIKRENGSCRILQRDRARISLTPARSFVLARSQQET